MPHYGFGGDAYTSSPPRRYMRHPRSIDYQRVDQQLEASTRSTAAAVEINSACTPTARSPQAGLQKEYTTTNFSTERPPFDQQLTARPPVNSIQDLIPPWQKAMVEADFQRYYGHNRWFSANGIEPSQAVDPGRQGDEGLRMLYQSALANSKPGPPTTAFYTGDYGDRGKTPVKPADAQMSRPSAPEIEWVTVEPRTHRQSPVTRLIWPNQKGHNPERSIATTVKKQPSNVQQSERSTATASNHKPSEVQDAARSLPATAVK